MTPLETVGDAALSLAVTWALFRRVPHAAGSLYALVHALELLGNEPFLQLGLLQVCGSVTPINNPLTCRR